MDATSIATSLVSQQSASRSQQVAIFAVKQQNELQNSLIDMVMGAAQASKAALPDGVGTKVDRSA